MGSLLRPAAARACCTCWGFERSRFTRRSRSGTRLQACATINKQKHNVGFGNGGHGLARHCRIDACFLPGNATGIDDNEPGILDAPLSVLPVPREPRKIGNQCIPTAG